MYITKARALSSGATEPHDKIVATIPGSRERKRGGIRPKRIAADLTKELSYSNTEQIFQISTIKSLMLKIMTLALKIINE